jgi:hypothetical protein
MPIGREEQAGAAAALGSNNNNMARESEKLISFHKFPGGRDEK